MNGDSPDLPKSDPNGGRSAAGTVAFVLAMVIAGVIGMVVVRQVMNARMGKSQDDRFAWSYSSADWKRRSLGDISIEAPFEIRRVPDMRARIAPEVRDAMEYHEGFDSGDSSFPRLMAFRYAYRDGTEASLEDVMHEAMTRSIKAFKWDAEDATPQFSSTRISVSGLLARRASYTGRARGRPIHIDAIFVQGGQQFWNVAVMSTGDSSGADVKRLLDSMQIY